MMEHVTNNIQPLWMSFIEAAHEWIPKLTISLVIFLIFFLLSIAVKQITIHSLKRLNKPHGILRMFGKTIQTIIVLIGIVTALGTAGVNVSALVASLGLVGFALGFALKDFLSNMLAGMMILFYRPFHIHDEISGKDFKGKVHEINLRYTTILDGDKSVMVPNAALLSNTITLEKRA